MTKDRMIEFVIMLLIERKSLEDQMFFNWMKTYFNINAFNERYAILLDDFMNRYALDKTEKSDETN